MSYLSSNVLWWALVGALVGGLATYVLRGRQLGGLSGHLLLGALGGWLSGQLWHWLAFHTVIADWLVARGWNWNWFTREHPTLGWLGLGHWWGGPLFAAIGAWLLLYLVRRLGYREPLTIAPDTYLDDWRMKRSPDPVQPLVRECHRD